jgi:CDP-glycerol glycerophosphotransferase (TagB/SpsB family)
MAAIERPGQVRHVEGADASPYLAAADVMVTDHSSVGFEFLVLDRPLIVFDAPDLATAARINPEKTALLRSAATVVQTPADLGLAARAELNSPSRLSARRRQVAEAMFHDAGHATRRALLLAREMLDAGAGWNPRPETVRHVEAIGGGIP